MSFEQIRENIQRTNVYSPAAMKGNIVDERLSGFPSCSAARDGRYVGYRERQKMFRIGGKTEMTGEAYEEIQMKIGNIFRRSGVQTQYFRAAPVEKFFIDDILRQHLEKNLAQKEGDCILEQVSAQAAQRVEGLDIAFPE